MLKRLWTVIVQFIEAFDVIDDPFGDRMSALESRVDETERKLRQLEKQSH